MLIKTYRVRETGVEIHISGFYINASTKQRQTRLIAVTQENARNLGVYNLVP